MYVDSCVFVSACVYVSACAFVGVCMSMRCIEKYPIIFFLLRLMLGGIIISVGHDTTLHAYTRTFLRQQVVPLPDFMPRVHTCSAQWLDFLFYAS